MWGGGGGVPATPPLSPEAAEQGVQGRTRGGRGGEGGGSRSPPAPRNPLSTSPDSRAPLWPPPPTHPAPRPQAPHHQQVPVLHQLPLPEDLRLQNVHVAARFQLEVLSPAPAATPHPAGRCGARKPQPKHCSPSLTAAASGGS